MPKSAAEFLIYVGNGSPVWVLKLVVIPSEKASNTLFLTRCCGNVPLAAFPPFGQQAWLCVLYPFYLFALQCVPLRSGCHEIAFVQSYSKLCSSHTRFDTHCALCRLHQALAAIFILRGFLSSSAEEVLVLFCFPFLQHNCQPMRLKVIRSVAVQ